MAKRERSAVSAGMRMASSGNGAGKSTDRGWPRALVVEADPGTQRVCREALESCRFVVDAVDSGVTALNVARLNPPAIILMDMQLRDALGADVIGWLRSNPALKSTPIIAISAVGENTANLSANGAVALLRKPISAAMIEDAVRKALG